MRSCRGSGSSHSLEAAGQPDHHEMVTSADAPRGYDLLARPVLATSPCARRSARRAPIDPPCFGFRLAYDPPDFDPRAVSASLFGFTKRTLADHGREDPRAEVHVGACHALRHGGGVAGGMREVVARGCPHFVAEGNDFMAIASIGHLRSGRGPTPNACAEPKTACDSRTRYRREQTGKRDRHEIRASFDHVIGAGDPLRAAALTPRGEGMLATMMDAASDRPRLVDGPLEIVRTGGGSLSP